MYPNANKTLMTPITMKYQPVFLLTGLIGGLLCVAPGASALMFITLVWGVGPAFFAAVVVGIIITGGRRHIQTNLLRYVAGLAVCFITYLVGLVISIWVAAFLSDWVGFGPSDFANSRFGIDVFLGLLAAAIFSAGGIALFAFVLTGRWSKVHFGRLLLAGIVTIAFTFIVNYAFQSYWSFFGVLVPLGSLLFCGAVGAHLMQEPAFGRQNSARYERSR